MFGWAILSIKSGNMHLRGKRRMQSWVSVRCLNTTKQFYLLVKLQLVRYRSLPRHSRLFRQHKCGRIVRFLYLGRFSVESTKVLLISSNTSWRRCNALHNWRFLSRSQDIRKLDCTFDIFNNQHIIQYSLVSCLIIKDSCCQQNKRRSQ